MSDPTPSTLSPALTSLLENVQRSLAGQKWRRARDDAKLGMKQDESVFLPLLIQANVGLAKELIGKKLLGDAKEIVVYLRKLKATEEAARLTELIQAPPPSPAVSAQASPEFTSPADRSSASAAEAHATAQRWQTLVSGTQLHQTEAIRQAADQLVAHGILPDQGLVAPADQALWAELKLILDGLASFASGQLAAALDSVRPLPLHSPFHPWRLWLRGAVAAHQGDFAKAEKFFSSIDPLSTAAKASRAYTLLCQDVRTVTAKESIPLAIHSYWGTLMHRPKLGPIVHEIDKEISQNNAYKALEIALKKIGGFPSISPSLEGLFTDVLFNAERISKLRGDTFDSFLQWADQKKRQKDVVGLLFNKTTSQLALHGNQLGQATTDWEQHLAIEKDILTLTPKDQIDGWWRFFDELKSCIEADRITPGQLKVVKGIIERVLKIDPLHRKAREEYLFFPPPNKASSERIVAEAVRDFPDDLAIITQAREHALMAELDDQAFISLALLRLRPDDQDLRDTTFAHVLAELTTLTPPKTADELPTELLQLANYVTADLSQTNSKWFYHLICAEWLQLNKFTAPAKAQREAAEQIYAGSASAWLAIQIIRAISRPDMKPQRLNTSEIQPSELTARTLVFLLNLLKKWELLIVDTKNLEQGICDFIDQLSPKTVSAEDILEIWIIRARTLQGQSPERIDHFLLHLANDKSRDRKSKLSRFSITLLERLISQNHRAVGPLLKTLHQLERQPDYVSPEYQHMFGSVREILTTETDDDFAGSDVFGLLKAMADIMAAHGVEGPGSRPPKKASKKAAKKAAKKTISPNE